MKTSTKLLSASVFCALFAACGGTNPVPSCQPSDYNQPAGPTPSGSYASNVLPFAIGDGRNACIQGNVNIPYVSVTICTPGSGNSANPTCQTINNILLDTGSFGLRVFQSLVTVPLTAITSGGNPVAECRTFGTGSEWGPVYSADVQIAGEGAVTTPIQLVNAGYSTIPDDSLCISPDQEPFDAGYNGILGVGTQQGDQDGPYYACAGNTCTVISSPSASMQIMNPVFQLPTDNNGLSVNLPSIDENVGAAQVIGTATLGIGTQTNNTYSGTNFFQAVYGPQADVNDSSESISGNFIRTDYQGTNYYAFIDSGSNTISFPASTTTFPDCGGNLAGLFCPASLQNVTVNMEDASSGNPTQIVFPIANASTILSNGNQAYPSVGAATSSDYPAFDWGLPFFYGRTVYVGIAGQKEPPLPAPTVYTGPYWAF